MGTTRGENLESIQVANRALVLSLLQRERVAARSELAGQSGLKQPTITKIVSDFLERKIVREVGFLEGKKGRRSIGLTLNPEIQVVAVRISRQYVMYGVTNLVGEHTDGPYRLDVYGAAPDEVVDAVRSRIAELISRHGRSVRAVGIAVPGPYLSCDDEVGYVTDWPGWEGVQIRREIQEGLSVPVVADHDANAGLLAETSFSRKDDLDATILYLAIGQGIGAGVSVGGEILRGAKGIAGEIGHTCVDIDGDKCVCGSRGCLTNYISTTAFVRFAKEAKKDFPLSSLPEEFGTAEALCALDKGDPAAEAAFDKLLDYLALGVTNLIFTYNPGTIIVGDEMAAAGERLIAGIRARISALRPESLFSSVDIRIAAHQPEPAYIGASAAAAHYLFGRPDKLNTGDEFRRGSIRSRERGA